MKVDFKKAGNKKNHQTDNGLLAAVPACKKRVGGKSHGQTERGVMETNRILQIALSFLVARMDKFEDKTWAGFALMDAAMVRLKNPELPYTDISRRFMRFLIKER